MGPEQDTKRSDSEEAELRRHLYEALGRDDQETARDILQIVTNSSRPGDDHLLGEDLGLLGTSHLMLGELKEAEICLRRAMKLLDDLGPLGPGFFLPATLAECLRRQEGRMPDAIDLLNRTIESVDPGHPHAAAGLSSLYADLARLHAKGGQAAEATAAADRAIEHASAGAGRDAVIARLAQAGVKASTTQRTSED